MATKSWIGQAVAVKQLDTITVSGTTASKTYTLTMNSKTIVYAATGGDTAATVVAALVALWNSTSAPPAPEFQEAVAADSTGGVFTVTGKVAGRPHVVTVAVSAGGTIGIVATTAATGPNFINNVRNFSDGALLANTDTLVFDRGNVDCLYGFEDAAVTALTTVTIQIDPGYKGRYIGLDNENTSGTLYAEYRTKSFTLTGGTLIVNNPNIQRVRVAFQSTLATVRVLQTGQRVNDLIPVVLVTGGAASSEVDLSRGDLALAFFAGETANFPTIKQSFVNDQTGDTRLFIGSGCSTVTAFTKSGGYCECYTTVTLLTQAPKGGTFVQQLGALTTGNIQGGNLVCNSTSTYVTLTGANDAFLDFDQDPRAKAVTNPIEIFGDNAGGRDTNKVIATCVVDYNNTTKQNFTRGSNTRVTFGTPA